MLADHTPRLCISMCNMNNKFFSLVIIFLFILGIGIFVLPQKENSSSEQRELKKNNSIKIDNLISSSEKVLSDQFYFRSEIIKGYYLINTSLSSSFGYNKIGDVCITQLSDDVARLNDDYLCLSAIDYVDDTPTTVIEMADNINKFDANYPYIKTYVYKITGINELINVNYPFQDEYWKKMTKQFSNKITYSKLSIDCIEDYQKYFFKTDFHWDAHGAYQGYRDIINMIGKDYDIGKPKKVIKDITFSNSSFQGYPSHLIGCLGDYDSINELILEDVDEFSYYENDIKVDYYKKKQDYIDKNIGAYYGEDMLYRLFDFKNDKPNLLVFCTSFSKMNNMWIASHFNKTLFIELPYKTDDFDLTSLIDKYNINVALIMYAPNSLYFSRGAYDIPTN